MKGNVVLIKISSKKVAATVMAGILFANAVVTPLTAFASELKPTPAVTKTQLDSDKNSKDTAAAKETSTPKQEKNVGTKPQKNEPSKQVVTPKKEQTAPAPSVEPKKDSPKVETPSSVSTDYHLHPIYTQDPTVNTQSEKKDVSDVKPTEIKPDKETKPSEEVKPSEETQSQEEVTSDNYTDSFNTSSSLDADEFSRDTTSRLIAHKYAQDMTTEGFISSIAEQCREVGQQNHLYASVMIAQAVLESGSGRSKLAEAPNNNLFGIKGSWKDKDGNLKSVSFDTREDDGSGNSYSTHAKFRKYDTVKDSLEDYAQLLTDTEKGMGNFYKEAWKTNNNTYKDACYALQGRYATDTTYAQKLVDIIATYDLTQYDNALDYEIVGRIKDEHAPQETIDQFGYRKLTMDDYANLEATITAQLGEKYVWGAQDPKVGFDCSGLVWYAYKNALGISLPRTSQAMAQQGELVKDFNDLRMGDLLFFSRNGDAHHVAMYLGNGYFIQSPHPGDVVKITAMKDYMPSFAKRILTFEKKEVIEERAQRTVFDTHNLQEF